MDNTQTQEIIVDAPVRKKPGRKPQIIRERITGVPVGGRNLESSRKINSKPQREVESLSRGRSQGQDNTLEASANHSGYQIPPVIIKRFDAAGFKLGFFKYGPEVTEHLYLGWRPVMNNEVPEISLNIIPNIPGLYREETKDYFIYLEHMLMKITFADWEEASSTARKRLNTHSRVLTDGLNKFDKRRGVQSAGRARLSHFSNEDDYDDSDDVADELENFV